MSDGTKFWLMIAAAAVIVILMSESLRKLSVVLIGSLVKPIVQQTGLLLARALLWATKAIPGAHWIILKNLFTPRSALLPTLPKIESDDGG